MSFDIPPPILNTLLVFLLFSMFACSESRVFPAITIGDFVLAAYTPTLIASTSGLFLATNTGL